VRDWNSGQCLRTTLSSLTRLLGIKADPEMVNIDRHKQALPLYHGLHQARLQAIESQLQQLPGLYLEANYRGGVSVRDRIARSRIVAKQILAKLSESGLIDSLPTAVLRPNW